jgi:hypothetical protein
MKLSLGLQNIVHLKESRHSIEKVLLSSNYVALHTSESD